jgi:hypothetical protein
VLVLEVVDFDVIIDVDVGGDDDVVGSVLEKICKKIR